MSTLRRKVVVVGAGLGGLNAVHALAKAPVDITLIGRNNHHLFQPLLCQVATVALASSDIAAPVRAIFARQQNVEVLPGEVDGIDTAAQTVSVRDGGTLPYGQLVLATGAASTWFGHDDWAEHSIGLKSLENAETLRFRLLDAFERAESRSDHARSAAPQHAGSAAKSHLRFARAPQPDEIQRLLTFVVVGGGPSGVELAGSIRTLARDTLARNFRHVHPNQARAVLFEGGPTVLAGFPEPLIRHARTGLERLGVEVRTGAQVERVDAGRRGRGGSRVAAFNVFWCAGVAATPAATGRRRSQPTAQCPGIPRFSPLAMSPASRALCRQRSRPRAKGAVPGPFHYRDQGSLAIIGRSSVVASPPHLKLTGFPAWLLWSGVHLFLLVGLQSRIMVCIQ